MAFEQAVTAQGIQIFVEHIPGFETANVEAYIGVGSIHEEPREEGLAHVLEHTVHLQTPKFASKKELLEYRGRHGMRANAYTNYRYTSYVAGGPEIEPMFAQMGEIVTRPKFPDEPIAAEMEIVRQELRQGWDNDKLTNLLAGDYVLFGEPYGRRIGGHVDRINFSPDEVRAFYERYYTSRNTKILAMGKVTLEEAVAYTEKHFSERKGDYKPQAQSPRTWLRKDTRSGLILDAKSSSVSSQVALVPSEVEAIQAEEDAYDIAAAVIGTYAQRYLRNEKGIAYYAGFGIETYNAQGKLALRTAVGEDNVARAEAAFDHILSRSVEDYTSAEVQASIGSFRGQALREMDSIDTRTRRQEYYIEHFGEPQDVASRVSKLRDMSESAIRHNMGNLIELMQGGPVLTHISGSKTAVGDVNQTVEISDLM